MPLEASAYGARLALDSVDLQPCPREPAALIGANGSVKSTPVALLSTLVEPGAGSLNLFGENLLIRKGRGLRALGARVGLVLAADAGYRAHGSMHVDLPLIDYNCARDGPETASFAVNKDLAHFV